MKVIVQLLNLTVTIFIIMNNKHNKLMCEYDIHDWYIKDEKFNLKLSGIGASLKTNRKVRICKNCYIIQNNGFGALDNNVWYNEDINNPDTPDRTELIRYIKIKKLKGKIK